MSSVGDRSRWMLSIRLFFISGLVVLAVWLALNVANVGVSEQTLRPAVAIPSDLKPAAMSADLAATAKANGQFSMDLYRRLAEESPDDNLFLSPFSISTALTMATEGAVDQTLDQMMNVLHLPKGRLSQIHRGQQGLQTAVVPVVPPGSAEKIADLRAKLKQANNCTQTLDEAKQFDVARKSIAEAAKLAKEINSLVSHVSAYELQMANALWMEQSSPLKPEFLATMKSHYGSDVFPVNFKQQPEPARLQINQWVAEQTHDRIRDSLPPQTIIPQTRLVIANTVYFKGDWALPFEASRTLPEPFQQSEDRSINVPMMHQWNENTACYGAFTAAGDLFASPKEVHEKIKDDDPSLYPDAGGHTMLALDYQGCKLQMILLVPQSVTGIHKLEKSLSYETLERWIGQLERRTAYIQIPRFKIEAKYELNETLDSLGMERPFEVPGGNHEGAQFDKMNSTLNAEDRIFISNVIHQTYVDVNEVGTEAAAVTLLTGVVSEGGFEMRPFVPVFKANKPFLFLIRHRETGTILFLGRYSKPSADAVDEKL